MTDISVIRNTNQASVNRSHFKISTILRLLYKLRMLFPAAQNESFPLLAHRSPEKHSNGCILFFSITMDSRLNVVTPIIKERTTPSFAPFASCASATEIRPKISAYIGTPAIVAIMTPNGFVQLFCSFKTIISQHLLIPPSHNTSPVQSTTHNTIRLSPSSSPHDNRAVPPRRYQTPLFHRRTYRKITDG